MSLCLMDLEDPAVEWAAGGPDLTEGDADQVRGVKSVEEDCDRSDRRTGGADQRQGQGHEQELTGSVGG